MAIDGAWDTYETGTPVAQMDRPSVERELRHVHGDEPTYATAHAARDALTDARAASRAIDQDSPWGELLTERCPAPLSESEREAISTHLARLHAAGHDASAALLEATDTPLPDVRPGRTLEYRLSNLGAGPSTTSSQQPAQLPSAPRPSAAPVPQNRGPRP